MFGIDGIDSIEEARLLHTQTIIDFIDFINDRENITEYVSDYPCTIKNVELSIIFHNAKPGKMAHVFNHEHKLCYYVKNPDPKIVQNKKVLEETFEEAKQIIYQNAQALSIQLPNN